MTGWVPRVVAVLALVGLAACEQMPAMGLGGPSPEGAGSQVAAAGDACGAAARQDLVGTSVGALDASTLPENRRVLFPGMAATMDFVPERLNVEVGTDDRIARVYCG
jgi:hypothetical protein